MTTPSKCPKCGAGVYSKTPSDKVGSFDCGTMWAAPFDILYETKTCLRNQIANARRKGLLEAAQLCDRFNMRNMSAAECRDALYAEAEKIRQRANQPEGEK